MKKLFFIKFTQLKKIFRKTFHPRCEFSMRNSLSLQRFYPLLGVSQFIKTFILPKEALAGKAAEAFSELVPVI
ncbi:hypothetical protein [Sphingobacterium mizutaii]|uniref:hypothetical protein n=1 Tax=Sphingobacterium mizutaii TaxID=1010 RepID=UPI00162A54CC|nr:hypothetical protein [Sphingobacterium mizutaii]